MLAAPAWPITSLFRAGTRRTALEPTEETPRGADHAQKNVAVRARVPLRDRDTTHCSRVDADYSQR